MPTRPATRGPSADRRSPCEFGFPTTRQPVSSIRTPPTSRRSTITTTQTTGQGSRPVTVVHTLHMTVDLRKTHSPVRFKRRSVQRVTVSAPAPPHPDRCGSSRWTWSRCYAGSGTRLQWPALRTCSVIMLCQKIDTASVLARQHVEGRSPAPVGAASGAERYFVLMTEDDTPLCPGGLMNVGRAISAAEARWGAGGLPEQGAPTKPGWASLRFSIGFIGIVIPLPALPSFGEFLRRYYLLKPPDLLVIEWMHGDWAGGIRADGAATFSAHTLEKLRAAQYAPDYAISIADFVAEDRKRVRRGGPMPAPGIPHLTAKNNLFIHLGAKSSLRATGTASFPKCDASFSGALWSFETFSGRHRQYCRHRQSVRLQPRSPFLIETPSKVRRGAANERVGNGQASAAGRRSPRADLREAAGRRTASGPRLASDERERQRERC